MLSAKRDRFVRNLVSGMSQRAAYLDAFSTSKKWKMKTVDTRAYELFKEPEVRERYEQLMKKAAESAIWDKHMAEQNLLWLIEAAKKQVSDSVLTSPAVTALLGAVKELNQMNSVGETEGKGSLDSLITGLKD